MGDIKIYDIGEIIEKCNSIEEMYERERYFIKNKDIKLNSKLLYEYNKYKNRRDYRTN